MTIPEFPPSRSVSDVGGATGEPTGAGMTGLLTAGVLPEFPGAPVLTPQTHCRGREGEEDLSEHPCLCPNFVQKDVRVQRMYVAYHEIGILIVAVVKQPLLGASRVGEGEDTATGRRHSTVTVFDTALGITWVFSSEPNTGLTEWNAWLGWWLDQNSRGGSVTVDSTDIGCSSSNTASAVGVHEDTSTDAIRRLLGAALLEASACLNLRVGPGRNSLLGRSQRDEGKDKEDLLECVHV